MPPAVDLTGQRFGRLTVTQPVHHKGRWSWICACECGNTTGPVQGRQLRSGHSKSCGCAQREAVRKTGRQWKHGHSRRTTPRSSTYKVWRGMITRCADERLPHRKYYLDRGITVCARWRESFEAFLEDMGEKPKGLTLDRIDNDRGYEPGNCRWATWSEQRRNQRRNT